MGIMVRINALRDFFAFRKVLNEHRKKALVTPAVRVDD